RCGNSYHDLAHCRIAAQETADAQASTSTASLNNTAIKSDTIPPTLQSRAPHGHITQIHNQWTLSADVNQNTKHDIDTDIDSVVKDYAAELQCHQTLQYAQQPQSTS